MNSKKRVVLAIAKNALEDGGRAASFLPGWENEVAKKLIADGYLSAAPQLYKGEVAAKLTPSGLRALAKAHGEA